MGPGVFVGMECSGVMPFCYEQILQQEKKCVRYVLIEYYAGVVVEVSCVVFNKKKQGR